jgi:ketosteroid isomerase-like protein
MSRENAEILRTVFERMNREGVSGAVPFFGSSVEWHTDPRVPEPGVYKGPEAVRSYLEGLYQALGDVKLEVNRTEPLDDETVFAQVTAYAGTTIGSEREVTLLDWCFIATFADGKFTRLRSFLDREEAVEAAGLRE